MVVIEVLSNRKRIGLFSSVEVAMRCLERSREQTYDRAKVERTPRGLRVEVWHNSTSMAYHYDIVEVTVHEVPEEM